MRLYATRTSPCPPCDGHRPYYDNKRRIQKNLPFESGCRASGVSFRTQSISPGLCLLYLLPRLVLVLLKPSCLPPVQSVRKRSHRTPFAPSFCSCKPFATAGNVLFLKNTVRIFLQPVSNGLENSYIFVENYSSINNIVMETRTNR
jgi:hypothetical protein